MLLFAKMDKKTTGLIEQSKGDQLTKTIWEKENKANYTFLISVLLQIYLYKPRQCIPGLTADITICENKMHSPENLNIFMGRWFSKDHNQ